MLGQARSRRWVLLLAAALAGAAAVLLVCVLGDPESPANDHRRGVQPRGVSEVPGPRLLPGRGAGEEDGGNGSEPQTAAGIAKNFDNLDSVYRISGYVVDVATGRRLPGGVIHVRTRPRDTWAVNDDGAFEGEVRTSRPDVSVFYASSEYVSARARVPLPTGGGTLTGVEIAADRLLVVRVRVIDPLGRPVEGATVSAESSIIPVVGTTDSAGEVLLHFPKDALCFRVRTKDGARGRSERTPALDAAQAPGPEEPILHEVRVGRPWVVRPLRIVAPIGDEIYGEAVTLRAYLDFWPLEVGLRVGGDAVSIEVPVSGDLVGRVDIPGRPHRSVNLRLSESDEEIRIEVGSAVDLQLTFQDTGGSPLPYLGAKLRNGGEDGTTPVKDAAVLTDDEGRWSGRLPAGTYDVHVDSSGDPHTSIVLKHGQAHEQTVVLDVASCITGELEDPHDVLAAFPATVVVRGPHGLSQRQLASPGAWQMTLPLSRDSDIQVALFVDGSQVGNPRSSYVGAEDLRISLADVVIAHLALRGLALGIPGNVVLVPTDDAESSRTHSFGCSSADAGITARGIPAGTYRVGWGPREAPDPMRWAESAVQIKRGVSDVVVQWE